MRTSLPSPPRDRLNILTFGAGAIGTYVGGSLALLGHRVVFLEVEPLVPVIRERGMSLEINGINQVVPNLTVVSTLGECLQIVGGTYDLAIFALKSYDTDSALASIRPYVEQMPPFLCLQNGVENEDKLAEVLGEARIIPASVTSAVGRRAIGSVVLERLRGIAIASDHPRSAFYLDLLNQAGLNARTCDNPRSMKWSKMLTNLLGNASSAILGMPPGDIFRNPGLYQLEMGQLREALSVMQALKLKVVDLPGTPVRMLAFIASRLPDPLSRVILPQFIGSGRGGKMPSFYLDLHSGRGHSEVGYLNGAVARFGESMNISTPVNRVLTRVLMGLTAGDYPPSMYDHQPEKLLALFR